MKVIKLSEKSVANFFGRHFLDEIKSKILTQETVNKTSSLTPYPKIKRRSPEINSELKENRESMIPEHEFILKKKKIEFGPQQAIQDIKNIQIEKEEQVKVIRPKLIPTMILDPNCMCGTMSVEKSNIKLDD